MGEGAEEHNSNIVKFFPNGFHFFTPFFFSPFYSNNVKMICVHVRCSDVIAKTIYKKYGTHA